MTTSIPLRHTLMAFALAFATPLLAQSAPALSATDRAIADAVDSHNTESLALLEQIVDINSGTMNFLGVRRVADVLRPQFDALGFKTRWIDGSAFHRVGHLIADHPGSGP